MRQHFGDDFVLPPNSTFPVFSHADVVCCGGMGQQFGIAQPVVQNDVGLGQAPGTAQRQKLGISGASSDQINNAAHTTILLTVVFCAFSIESGQMAGRSPYCPTLEARP